MAAVAIVMGSDSDMEIMGKAAAVLDEFGVEYEMNIISAHREADLFFDWAKGLEGRGIRAVIAGAGMAAHLPGMCAALFPMPVIGVPLKSKAFSGEDALYSIVQMPPGVPVATMSVDGGKNAGIMAVKMLAMSDDSLLEKLKEYAKKQKAEVEAKDARLKEVGYKRYIEEKK